MSIAATASLAAVPLAAQAVEPVAPAVTITTAPGDPGILVATATYDPAAPVKTVVAQVQAGDGTQPAQIPLALDADGTWHSARLDLGSGSGAEKYHDYQVSVVATDANGDASPASTMTLHYLKQPVVVEHDLGPLALDVLHPLVYAKGTLQVFDPATGEKSAAAGSTVQATWDGATAPVATAEVQEDGRYAIKRRPDDLTKKSTLTVSLQDEPGTAPLQETAHGKAFLDQAEVSATAGAGRVVMNNTKVTVKYPAKVTMAGRVLVGTLPVPSATVQISFKGKPAGSVKTAANGSFSVVSTPRYDGSYTFAWAPGELQAPYVTSMSPGSELVSVTDRTSMSFVAPSINEESVMHINGKLTTSSSTLVPKGSRVWLQRSSNGKTGWANVGYLPISYYGFVKLEGYVPHASGYFRLHYYGGTGLQPTSSWVYHSSRRETRLIKLNASPEPVRKGATVTVTGVLQRLDRTWVSMGKGQQVQIFFRPKGASTNTNFTYLGMARTNAAGGFTFKGKAVRDGDWTAAWFTPSRWNVNAYGASDAVDVK